MKTSIRTFAAILAMSLAVLIPAPSRADFAFGLAITPPGPTPNNELPGDQLLSIDTTTGKGSLVGSLDPSLTASGLATSAGRLFTFDTTSDRIIQLNPSSGGTLATFNIGISPGSVVGQGGLAFQSANIGFLTAPLDASLNPVNALFRFDLGTGTSMMLASTPEPLEALAFGPSGILYGLGQVRLDNGFNDLFRIDPLTGASMLLGSTMLAAGSPTGGLTFGADGTLFATLDDKLYSLNKSNGAATAVGSSDPTDGVGFSSIAGLASPSAVPEPSSVAMTLVGLGVVACRLLAGRGTKARPSA